MIIRKRSRNLRHLRSLPEYHNNNQEREYWREHVSAATTEPTPLSEKTPPPPVEGRLNRRIYGIRAKWLLLGLGVLILLIIVLGAGLGAGLHSKHSQKASQGSQSGALNGTSISVVTQTFSTDEKESLVMYFQHWTGQIRYMQLGDDGVWKGGDSSSIVASDAKNNTPIAAVSYVWDGVSFWRVFYIDNTNLIKEIWAGNNTQGWALGPLSDMSISAMDDDHVGMVACWEGPTSPKEYAEGYATTTDSSLLAIRLVYAQDATTFQQLRYTGDTQDWVPEQTLPNLNGHASPACYNRDEGTVDYMMVVNLQNEINVYWRDTNTSLTNTTSHPINRWTNTSISIPNVEDNATLGYTKYLYAQEKNDQLIRAYSFSFAAENTTLDTGAGFVVQGNPGLPSTGLGITARPNPAGGDDVMALYQTDGSHIGYYERDADGVSWNSANILIPI
ncbi:hypothetical protein H2200_000353 [Cladophialophora chaetospira]|uniref:Fucose-specific lectin n=1 Tax=Cladophialophora chaetospira TaxID=386627 RepID=A0AA38XPB0_9EURO|nr:hypothetical protein H2200_000353 [Cladophialophora chaetospira]